MAEYQGITYNKKAERLQKDGSIEVDVDFIRDDIHRNVTFRFDNDQSDLDTRCQNKIDKFIEKRMRKRTLGEIESLILNHIISNESVTAALLTSWRNEDVLVKGAI